jgi:hypothetical protein
MPDVAKDRKSANIRVYQIHLVPSDLFRREYILFRAAGHSGISSAHGINPIQFRELDHAFPEQPKSIPTEFRIFLEPLPIPEFRKLLLMPEFRTGIAFRPQPHS